MRMSWSVLLIACPRCSAPVTFGGGITMQYGSPGAAGSAWKHPSASHTRYASDSTDAGLYVLASSVFMSQSLAASPNRRGNREYYGASARQTIIALRPRPRVSDELPAEAAALFRGTGSLPVPRNAAARTRPF